MAETGAERQVRLRKERDRFLAFAFAGSDILLELDKNGLVTYADGATQGLLARESEALLGESFLGLVSDEDRHHCEDIIAALKLAPRIENITIHLKSETLGDVAFLANAFHMVGLREHYYITLQSSRDVVNVEELLSRDVDSGLYKKHAFIKRANAMIRAKADSLEEALKVSLLDFPELKELLDMLPEEEANKLLLEISDYLKDKSADGDTVGLLSGSSYSFVHKNEVDAKQVAENVVKITQKYRPNQEEPKSANFRVKTLDAKVGELSEEDSAHALLYSLNRCAEEQKDEMSVRTLTEGYEAMLEDTVGRMQHFRETVQETRFDLAFQPIVDLKDGHIHHFETLVRIHDSSVFSNPFEFINFGEKAGIIGEFDLIMIQRALEVLQRASAKRYYPNISINVSGKSLNSQLFQDSLKELMGNYKGRRKQVVFEVTESSKIEDLEKVNTFLQWIRAGGSHISLDDFGTGESSFDYLRRLEVDFVKIDGSYVRESLLSNRGRLMLKAMADMCRQLDITTIGEMVEDEKNAKLLWDCGVRFGQGYLFGKPDIDEDALENCNKPTPYYGGAMRIKRLGGAEEEIPQSWDDL